MPGRQSGWGISVGTRIRIGDTEFELSFDLATDEELPPGVEWAQKVGEEENAWPAEVPAKLVAYARELAISPDHVAHWVSFFVEHPHGQQAWEEIRPLWTPRRRSRGG